MKITTRGHWRRTHHCFLGSFVTTQNCLWNNLSLSNTYNGITFCWQFMFLMLNIDGKCLSLKAEIKKFSKLPKISCWQVMKRKMTITPWCLTCFTYPCSLCRGVFKKGFFCTAVVILGTQGTHKGGRVEDHRIMVTGNLHLPQWYTNVYSSNTLHI